MVVVWCGMCAHTINSLQEQWRTSIWAFRSHYRARGCLHSSLPGWGVGGKAGYNWSKGEAGLNRCCLSPRAPTLERDIPPFMRSAVESRCVLMWLFFRSHAAGVNITAVHTPAAPGSQISTGTLLTHKTAAAGPWESGCSFYALFGFMSCINSSVICRNEISGLESPTSQINKFYLTCASKPCL